MNFSRDHSEDFLTYGVVRVLSYGFITYLNHILISSVIVTFINSSDITSFHPAKCKQCLSLVRLPISPSFLPCNATVYLVRKRRLDSLVARRFAGKEG